MSRTARPLMHNASYHVISRGIRKEDVFLCKEDFEKYLDKLWKYKNKFSSKIYAYCLMPNHVHILLDPDTPTNLKRIMHGLNLSYATYFNYKYEQCGHLWQNRYKSLIAQNDEYLINLVSYIEYNPVKANICMRAEDYPWSSYSSRVLGENNKIIDQFRF